MRVAGVCSRPTSLPRSSSSDGRVASALTPVGVEQLLAHRPADDGQLVVRLGVGDRHLRRRHRIARKGDRRRPGEQRRQPGELRAFESATREPVLGHLEAGAALPASAAAGPSPRRPSCRSGGSRRPARSCMSVHAGSRPASAFVLGPLSSPMPWAVRDDPARPGCTWIRRSRPRQIRFACPRSSSRLPAVQMAPERSKRLPSCLMCRRPKLIKPFGANPSGHLQSRTGSEGRAPRASPSLAAAPPFEAEATRRNLEIRAL